MGEMVESMDVVGGWVGRFWVEDLNSLTSSTLMFTNSSLELAKPSLPQHRDV
eukprot:m.476660 g.476660  ORF g.476660 m.476660 type:complete len:52 (-) comp41522_c0_seq1:44-199(-)